MHAFRVFILRNLGADHIDVIRQRHHALEKEITGMLQIFPRQLVANHVGRRKHDWGGFTGDTGNAQNGRGQDTRQGIRKDIFANGLPLRGTKRE